MLTNLPRNGFGRVPTRINDVLRHFTRLRPSLLGCFTRVAKVLPANRYLYTPAVITP